MKSNPRKEETNRSKYNANQRIISNLRKDANKRRPIRNPIRCYSLIRLIRIFASYLMTTFDKLADLFRQFPGIGPRQAKRFVYFLLSRDKAYLEDLNMLIANLKDAIVQCKECFRFFQGKRGTLCLICADLNRNTGELMVVAKDTDLEAMEKSGIYHGRYFVLGGTIPLVERKNGDKLRLKELLSFIKSRLPASDSGLPESDAGKHALNEIILALSANPDGEHTGDALHATLAPLLADTKVKISTLGRGLSTGSELEYADSETLKSALKNRFMA